MYILFLLCSLVSFDSNFSEIPSDTDRYIQDTIPKLLTVTDTIIVFDYDTYEESVSVVESQIFNPAYYLQEQFMKDTITTLDTIAVFDPKTSKESQEIVEMKIPFGVKMLLDYEYGKDVPDFDNVQKYLDMCERKKMK